MEKDKKEYPCDKSYKDKLWENEEDCEFQDDFASYREGDSDYDDNFKLLQRSRWVLEDYFKEKPTPDQVIAFANSIAVKDLHSLLTMEDGDCPLYVNVDEKILNSKSEIKWRTKKVGLTTILNRLVNQ